MLTMNQCYSSGMNPKNSAYPAAYADPQAHKFRIGLATIGLEHWFEGKGDPLDEDPAHRKVRTLLAHPDQAFAMLDRSWAAQAEILGLMSAHFGLDPVADTERPPLQRAAALVDDDLCVMEKMDGHWVLTAASLCAPSFFSAAEVIGKSLGALHDPVTGFGAELLPRVARIFDSLRSDQLVERRNWSVVASGDLFLPDSKPVRAAQPGIRAEDAGSALFIRMERQTLRLMPQTGAILFTIRIWRHDLNWLTAHPDRLNAFAQAWDKVISEEGQTFRDYKGLGPLDPLVRAFLAQAKI
jgi:hypothetical protein